MKVNNYVFFFFKKNIYKIKRMKIVNKIVFKKNNRKAIVFNFSKIKKKKVQNQCFFKKIRSKDCHNIHKKRIKIQSRRRNKSLFKKNLKIYIKSIID